MTAAWKKAAALLLCLVLCAALAPAVMAAEEETICTVKGTDLTGPSNDEMYTAYLRKMFYGIDGNRSKSPANLQQMLGADQYVIEQGFKAEIEKVAQGIETDTKLYFVPTGVDVSTLVYDDLVLIYRALLVDCTSSLYWHDKRMGCSFSRVSSENKLGISLAVAMDYRANPEDAFTVDTARIDAAMTALANADSIISAYSGSSDADKLRGYMLEICKRNVYNDDAAYGRNNADVGIDPWQLVYVFDNDPDTNVVCEGYSKAFEYLCDNTRFNSSRINCICVSGLAYADDPYSGHMWNVVRMDDNKNYVVDVTWSEPYNDSPSNQTCEYAMFLSYVESGSVRDGYALSYGSNGTSPVRAYYLESAAADGHPNMLALYTEAELTISAQAYNENGYTVHYNANGGYNAPADQTKARNVDLTLSSVRPQRDSVTGNYTVTFDPGGGTCPVSSLSAEHITSYTFNGWNTQSDGSGTDYAPGGTYAANASATLYAQWTESASTAAVTLPAAEWEGHTFQGWAENSAAASGVSGSYTPEGSVTLHALWKTVEYAVHYDANGGYDAPDDQIKSYNADLTLSSDTPGHDSVSGNYTVSLIPNGGTCPVSSLCAEHITSYTFNNWNTQSDGSGTGYAPGGTYAANAPATLYAQWNSTVNTAAVTLPTPEWTGHTFLGWAESSAASSGVSGSYTPEGDVTLYAIWKLNEYTVHYDANGGTGAPDDQIKYHNVKLTLRSVRPARAGGPAESYTVTFDPNGGSCGVASLAAERTAAYSFRNWNTQADGSGTGYAPGGTYAVNASVTLYAQWNESFSTAAVTLPDAVREDYTFRGWAESPTATAGVTGRYTPGGDVTLYAVWKYTPRQPVITGQPQEQAAVAGEAVTFTVTAEGQDLTYQWYFQKKGSSSWSKVKTDGTGDSLTITSAKSLNGYKYRCTVKNSTGKVTSKAAKFTFIGMPKITTQPKAASVKAGKTATFKVKASGYGVAYQWYCLVPGSEEWLPVEGGITATLRFITDKTMTGYKYRCVIRNEAGETVSKAVKLTVK